MNTNVQTASGTASQSFATCARVAQVICDDRTQNNTTFRCASPIESSEHKATVAVNRRKEPAKAAMIRRTKTRGGSAYQATTTLLAVGIALGLLFISRTDSSTGELSGE